jgi:tryptophanyl-tRNA synthetase
MHKAVSPPALVEHADVSCRTASWGCGDCKEALAKSLSDTLTPIRTKAEALRRDPELVLDALADGARKCREIARETMREVRDRMGLVPAKE